jgi:hypothetical protein
MLEKTSPVGRWRRPWWRKLLGVVIAVVVAVTILNPELAFLGFLLDPLILDVAILLLGAQLLLFNGQIRAFLVSTYSGITRHLSAVGLRR